MQRLLSFCFLISGAAGLIFEVIWVRQFGNLFGNTTGTAALVVAVFMAGLGLGGALAGRFADAKFAADPVAPLRLYARVEFAVAALAAINVVALPLLGNASGALSSYVVGAHGWHFLSFGSWAWRCIAALVLLLPVTTLMGATLTLLIRYVVKTDVGNAGERVGQLYAINTLGAAFGAFATDRFLVPALGLHATQLFAVLLNLIAGLGASRLAGQPVAPAVAAPAEPVASVEDTSLGATPLRLVGFATALAGFAAMGLEIVWFRFLSTLLGGYRSIFSLTLAVVLVGIVVGSAVSGRLLKRFKAVELFIAAQALFVLTALAAFAFAERTPVSTLIDVDLATWRSTPESIRSLWQLTLAVRPMLFVVGIPAICMGATIPLANACLQRASSVVGRRAGALYLWNTAGGVIGSTIAGFVLIPNIGSQSSIGVLLAFAALALVPMFLALRSEVRTPLFASALGLSLVALLAWSQLDALFLVKKSHLRVQDGTAELLAVKESSTELLAVQRKGTDLKLFTNGHSMSASTLWGQRYMRSFAHVPLLMNPKPEKALVICFGVGNTLHATSLHPLTTLEVADLSANVLEHASWFAEVSNHGVLSDPRLQVFVNDGRQHLKMSEPGSYDLITLEPPPISFAGVSSLYSKEFYALAHSRLRSGGAMTQWLPAYQVSGQTVRQAIRAFIEVFPGAVMLSGASTEFILYGVKDGPAQLDLEQVRRALAERPNVQRDLDTVSAGTLTELVGMFTSSSMQLLFVTTDSMPLTDDEPTLEYSELTDVIDTQLPANLLNVTQVATYCPTCFDSTGAPVAGLELLPAYLDLLSQAYTAPNVQQYSVFPLSAEFPKIKPPPRGKEAVDSSRYLQQVFGRGPQR
ncbi:MAG: fused MFS/spermidine synthase [Archangium sp.]|nr:fused MFS/spermidine synthase [Archangium sp.]